MVLSFTGEHTQKVDGKGRMSIPADFRRVLESQDPDWTDGLNPRMYLLYGDHLKKELHLHSQRARKWIILHDTTVDGDVGEVVRRSQPGWEQQNLVDAAQRMGGGATIEDV